MLKRVRVLAAAPLALWPAEGARALEYCVTCEGPPAMYRCVIDGTPDGAGKNPSVSLYCISQMATRGKHETCAVSRGAPFPCPGFTALVTPPKGLPAPEPAASPPPAREGDTAPPPATETPSQVPRTVEELAGQTVKSSKEGLQQAGDAIGGTAKKAGEHIGSAGSAIGSAASKTWNCITSLFSTCGGDEPEDTAEDDAPRAAESEPPAGTPPAGDHRTN